MAYDNEKRGVLFKNQKKEEGSNKPDYTGSATIEGVEYFMDAWMKTSESGRKFMSFSFNPKTKQPAQQAAPRKPLPKDLMDADNDPPF
jgi:uncharacterized protein (DUF736 family)